MSTLCDQTPMVIINHVIPAVPSMLLESIIKDILHHETTIPCLSQPLVSV